ncbi:MAG: c-type cytochrome [Gammaproteobacteria bacterium]|jgi:cytochrome c oxidase cbb3-type subunit 3|nr:c-type cytochrome [Gammaproteobacteria bacterium]MBT3723381.1 c-type cytochrome [Gammaproteobacteria bacterium]MBT4078018.1 c-type cytochrome [Gammaproteobacteria bacterium]MBT4193850.1 c-type cytochrome [Gammaproteobacteria bacterium]MBT4449352.1 c-type cytochrome [Gammaproteobacteria bacterium]
MKQTMMIKLSAVFTVSTLLAFNVFADYSKSFEGYRIFKSNCSVCHGTDGRGFGPLAGKLGTKPADLTNNANLNEKSDRDLFRIIEGTAPHGTVSKDMPQWGMALPQTQIKSLVSYIRYLHSSKYPTIGNPLKGKDLYDENCVLCHGTDGKGEGVLTKVYNMEPADHTDAGRMNRMSNDKMRLIISHGEAGAGLMPAWSGTLSDSEIDNLIGYIRILSSK